MSTALPLIASTLTTNGIAFIIAYNYGPRLKNEETKQWYASIKKAPGTPPNWVFAPGLVYN